MSNDGPALRLYIPRPEDGWFYVRMMSDPATMAYNAPWFPPDGCIPNAAEAWDNICASWIGRVPERFYAYLQREDGVFVGDVCFYVTGREGERMIGIVIHSAYRGMGYSEEGLRLLIGRAFSHKEICSLRNEFEVHRKAALHIHEKAGFAVRITGEDAVLTLKR